MHFTKDCTGLEDAQIKFLVELKENLLMVCNGCQPKKTSNISSTEENSAMAPNIKAHEAKMSDFMKTMKQSAIKVDELKAEMTKLKTESQPPSNSYASKIGAVAANRRTFYNTPKQSLGIRIKGVPKAPDDTTDWLQDDKKNVLSIMDQLGVDAKLTRLTRLCRKDPKKGPCTIIINIDNKLEKEVMASSAHKLKVYSRIPIPCLHKSRNEQRRHEKRERGSHPQTQNDCRWFQLKTSTRQEP